MAKSRTRPGHHLRAAAGLTAGVTLVAGLVVVAAPTANAAPGSPVALVADTASTTPGAPTSIDVLGNDTGPVSAGSLSLATFAPPAFGSPAAVTATGTSAQGGTVSVVGGQVQYTPAAGFTGTDTFDYWATEIEWRSAATNLPATITDFANPKVGSSISSHNVVGTAGMLSTGTGATAAGDWTNSNTNLSQYVKTRGVRLAAANPCDAGDNPPLTATLSWVLAKTNNTWNDSYVASLTSISTSFLAAATSNLWIGDPDPVGQGPGTHTLTLTHPAISTLADLSTQNFYLWAQPNDSSTNYTFPNTSGAQGNNDASDYNSISVTADLSADTRRCDLQVQHQTVTVQVARAAVPPRHRPVPPMHRPVPPMHHGRPHGPGYPCVPGDGDPTCGGGLHGRDRGGDEHGRTHKSRTKHRDVDPRETCRDRRAPDGACRRGDV